MNDCLLSSDRMDWETPDYLFSKLDSEFHFTLDPCSSVFNHKCDNYFTEKEDGLIQDWSGHIVFCNPPYGRNINKWVYKSFSEWSLNNVTVVLLIPARTDTSYFHDIILANNAEVRFIRGRIKFKGAKFNAPFPSMIVIFRGDSI